MTVNIPVISENEYPLFRSIGVISQFPKDFVAFMHLMTKKNNEVCHGGVIPINVNVDFAGFMDWFIGSRKSRRKNATYQDLLKYVAICVNQSSNICVHDVNLLALRMENGGVHEK